MKTVSSIETSNNNPTLFNDKTGRMPNVEKTSRKRASEHVDFDYPQNVWSTSQEAFAREVLFFSKSQKKVLRLVRDCAYAQSRLSRHTLQMVFF